MFGTIETKSLDVKSYLQVISNKEQQKQNIQRSTMLEGVSFRTVITLTVPILLHHVCSCKYIEVVAGDTIGDKQSTWRGIDLVELITLTVPIYFLINLNQIYHRNISNDKTNLL